MTTSTPDFGTDVWCDSDLDPTMPDTSGWVLLAQELGARLVTPRGSQPEDEDYGTDARGDLSRGLTTAQLMKLPDRYAAELAKDDRVTRVDSTISTQTADALTVDFAVLTGAGPFKFTVGITDALATIKSVTGPGGVFIQ